MEQLSFWLKFIFGIFIIIPLVSYGVYKILSIMPYSLVEKLLGNTEDNKYEREIKSLTRNIKLKNLKSQLRDYGLTSEEIDNYIKEQKIEFQHQFNEIKTLENLIEIKESEKKAKVLFPHIKKRDLEDEKEDFKTKTQYKIIFGLINLYNQDYEEINFSNRIGLLDIHIYEVSEDERYVVNNQLETDISDIFPNSIAIENGNSWEIINDIPKVYYDTIDFTGEHNHIESFEEDEYNMALNFIKNLKIIPFKKAKELGIIDLN